MQTPSDTSSLLLDPHSALVRNLFKKKELLESGDSRHEEIRPLLVIYGGAMRGVSGGGIATALNLLGLNQCFDMIIGASAGTAFGAYFLGGTEQTYLGTSIFYDELRDRKFLNPLNPFEFENLDWLETVFRESPKRLATETVAAHRTPLYIALTDYADNSMHLFNSKEYPTQITRLMKISCALPLFYGRRLDFDGRRYLDGNIALTIETALRSEPVKALNPTDILFIPSMELSRICAPHREPREIIAPLFPLRTRRLLLKRLEIAEDLAHLKKLSAINVGALMLPENSRDVRELTTDAKKLWRLGNASLRDTLERFGAPHLYRPLNTPAVY